MIKLKLIILPYLVMLLTFVITYTISYQYFFIKTGDVTKEMHEVGNIEFILLLVIPFLLNQLFIGHRIKLLRVVKDNSWLYRGYIIGLSLTMTASAGAFQMGFINALQTLGLCLAIILSGIFIPQLKEPISESIPIINDEMLGF
ncbi:MAG: hypothetical protein ACOVQE_02860 [Chitinophagaceae bacterium]